MRYLLVIFCVFSFTASALATVRNPNVKFSPKMEGPFPTDGENFFEGKMLLSGMAGSPLIGAEVSRDFFENTNFGFGLAMPISIDDSTYESSLYSMQLGVRQYLWRANTEVFLSGAVAANWMSFQYDADFTRMFISLDTGIGVQQNLSAEIGIGALASLEWARLDRAGASTDIYNNALHMFPKLSLYSNLNF